jgi:hypothetical protein
MWPVQIRGQKFGKCRGLVDLAIDSGPEMTIWAFGREGVAQTWQIDDGSLNGTVRKRFVIHDGTVREGDVEGNIEMRDTPSPQIDNSPPPSLLELETLGEETFDGAESTQTFRTAQVPDYPFSVDADGDVLMAGVPEASRHVSGRLTDNYFRIITLPQGRDVQFPNPRFSSRSFIEQASFDGLDLVDELTSISRIEIEIR